MAPTAADQDALWNKIHADSSAFEQSMDALFRKQTGSYYTALPLARQMMQELVDSLPAAARKTLCRKTFLEPCAGTGNFVFAYLRVCKDLRFSRKAYAQLLNNIYVCDSNPRALAIYRENLQRAAAQWFGLTLDDAYFSTHMGAALLFDVHENATRYIPISERFPPEVVGRGFDIVATNPPYKNLKAERAHYQANAQHAADQEKYAAIGKLAQRHFHYATAGTLNLYKLFVEEFVERYVADGGVCSLLIPASILSDKSCAKLRTRILDTCAIRSLRVIAENSAYVDASQAMCTMLLHKGQKTTRIFMDGSFSGDLRQGSYAAIEDILDEATGNAILVLSDNEHSLRKKMRAHPTIKEIPYLDNLRGELDITFNKAAITADKTPYPLLRGRHIHYYHTAPLAQQEYVRPDFVAATAKQAYIFAPRLACQQIVNMAKKRRIAFAPVAPGSVLANSCNFIAVQPNDDGVDSDFLLGILNSTLIDWYFKLTSSNNHINNYEIDHFPIPIGYGKKAEIAQKVRLYLQSGDDALLPQIDALVYDAYGIAMEADSGAPGAQNAQGETPPAPSVFTSPQAAAAAFCRDLRSLIPTITQEECADILAGRATVQELCFRKKPNADAFDQKVLQAIAQKYTALGAGKILNHTTFKLSELDLEMIRPIPQGGSWKDIPAATVQKSKRLARIRQTGGRTTLYGRIDYAKPSYTITTYFNRPGNGTYVHPVHDRVLSVREAARFQCFPDDYLFCGNKSELLKQVGNAVPVLLAYSLGKTIREKTGCRTSVDLFSGAGGMTYGFKRAGIQAVVANDIVRSACVTLKANSPEIPVLCGDITDGAIKDAVIRAGQQAKADIICGGPPCQGFSLAGFRKKDDPRNQLFRDFVDIVSAVNPKVIVFENVEGLLSYQQGDTYRNIIALFSELGYHTEGQKLLANHYGVPQRRKRVFILCTRKDLHLDPADLYPAPVTPNADRQVSAYETIFDLEQIPCAENAAYNSAYTSPLLRYLKGELEIAEYFDAVRDERGILLGDAEAAAEEEL